MMSRRSFLGAMTAAIGGVAAPVGAPHAGAGKRPNILLIMCDDMGWSDIGCYGSEIETPNLDRLAAEGIRFTQFYNCARCCPTRAALLTGLYPHQAGMGAMVKHKPADDPHPYQGYLNDRCVTLAEVLKDSGYGTYMSGKWHVGEFRPHWPVDRGFDRYYGLLSGAMNYFDIGRSKREGLVRGFARDGQAIRPPAQGFYATDAFTDEALAMLAAHRREHAERPFFMYLAYNAPHWPLHAHPEDIARFRGRYAGGWAPVRAERFRRQQQMGLLDPAWQLSPQDPGAADWNSVDDNRQMALRMAIYAAQIHCMDRNIGRVLEHVRDTGELDRTLVMFLSDNGGCVEGGPTGFDGLGGNNGPLGTASSYSSYGRSWSNASNTPFRMHKSYVHEGGISTPLVARWPGVVPAGTITHEVGHVVDIMATCCEVAGADYPVTRAGHDVTPCEGLSLLPVLRGGNRPGHGALYWEHIGNQAVRRGNMKLVRVKQGDWELYDVARDRSELNDLAPSRPADVKAMSSAYRDWASRCGVRM